MASRTPRSSPVTTNWTSPETGTIHEFLEREDVQSMVVTITKEWNQMGLLGVDLAHTLHKLVYKHLTKNDIDTSRLAKVDWNQLAEHYALEISGVDEDELTRRRVEAGGTA